MLTTYNCPHTTNWTYTYITNYKGGKVFGGKYLVSVIISFERHLGMDKVPHVALKSLWVSKNTQQIFRKTFVKIIWSSIFLAVNPNILECGSEKNITLDSWHCGGAAQALVITYLIVLYFILFILLLIYIFIFIIYCMS